MDLLTWYVSQLLVKKFDTLIIKINKIDYPNKIIQRLNIIKKKIIDEIYLKYQAITSDICPSLINLWISIYYIDNKFKKLLCISFFLNIIFKYFIILTLDIQGWNQKIFLGGRN